MKKPIKKKFEKPYIIAEIGNNHEGSLINAKKLIIEAAKCRVDAVKFQTFNPFFYVSEDDKKRFKRLQKFSLSKKDYFELKNLSKKLNLDFISTPFDISSAYFLSDLVDSFKISSGDNDYYSLIERVLSFKKKTFISTGLLNFEEIINLQKYLNKRKKINQKIVFFHCVSGLPAELEANLEGIKLMKSKISFDVGYSDHTVGISAAITAFFYGANYIEKHFTLDKNFSSFRDHQLSADPTEMKQLVNFFRDYKKLNKKVNFQISKNEKKNLKLMRRSYYFLKDKNIGEVISEKDFKYVRPD